MPKMESREKTTEQLKEDLRKTREELAIQKWGLEKTMKGMKVLVKELIQKGKEKEGVDRAKTEFISIASHQLRTPISALNWLTEGIQYNSKNLDIKQQKYLTDLASQAKRLTELVEDLLDFSRIELKSEIMLEKHQIEFPAFIEEFVKEMKTYAESKKHDILFSKKITEPVIVEINKRAIYNVLQNLVSNGIDYSPENTDVTITLEKINDLVKVSIYNIKISVSNKGPVIPKEDQARIFDRFYRTEQAKKIKPEGTGLGLYVVKKIVEDIGGKVGFESEEGQDTTFWFTIPIK